MSFLGRDVNPDISFQFIIDGHVRTNYMFQDECDLY